MLEDLIVFMLALGLFSLPFGVVGLIGCIVRPDVFKF